MEQSSVNISAGVSSDISRLAQGANRVDVALDALRNETLSSSQIEQLRELAERYAPAVVQPKYLHSVVSSVVKTPLMIAEEIISSYKYENKLCSLTVPAGVSDIEAMRSLNTYFHTNLPRFGRDAIKSKDLEWYEGLPKRFPNQCAERDITKPRHIALQPIVPGTRKENRTTQARVLREAGFVFSDPREQALVCAVSACVLDGQNVFEDLHVRSCAPSVILKAFCPLGFSVFEYHDDYAYRLVAASGSRVHTA